MINFRVSYKESSEDEVKLSVRLSSKKSKKTKKKLRSSGRVLSKIDLLDDIAEPDPNDPGPDPQVDAFLGLSSEETEQQRSQLKVGDGYFGNTSYHMNKNSRIK